MNTSDIALIPEYRIKIHPDLDDAYYAYGDNPHSGWAKERCLIACQDIELRDGDLFWSTELHELLLKAYTGNEVALEVVRTLLPYKF